MEGTLTVKMRLIYDDMKVEYGDRNVNFQYQRATKERKVGYCGGIRQHIDDREGQWIGRMRQLHSLSKSPGRWLSPSHRSVIDKCKVMAEGCPKCLTLQGTNVNVSSSSALVQE